MTPQLYINYKLKSVAHINSKAMIFRFLNTIIDDLFAFIITMPWLKRLSCFRDGRFKIVSFQISFSSSIFIKEEYIEWIAVELKMVMVLKESLKSKSRKRITNKKQQFSHKSTTQYQKVKKEIILRKNRNSKKTPKQAINKSKNEIFYFICIYEIINH